MRYGKLITASGSAIAAGIVALILAQGVALGEGLKATPDHFDFGTLKEGDPAKITVEIENTGTEPVEITNVRTS